MMLLHNMYKPINFHYALLSELRYMSNAIQGFRQECLRGGV